MNLKYPILYINVARFSPEKGIKRLVEAFERFRQEKRDTYLFVIGGHGIEFDEIYQYLLENELDNIVLIRSMSNVFPILSKCDVFILSSYYEGLPMSIMEALILKKTVVCTDIPGPRDFLRQGYGYLIPDSVEGIYQGFQDSYRSDLNLKEFDYIKFNEQAIEEFYTMLES